MSDNEAAVLITMFITLCITMSRFLKFIRDMANLDDPRRDEARESAWDDEIA